MTIKKIFNPDIEWIYQSFSVSFYTRPLNQLLFLSSLGFFFITFAMLLSDTGLWYVPVKSADLIKTFITMPGPKFM